MGCEYFDPRFQTYEQKATTLFEKAKQGEAISPPEYYSLATYNSFFKNRDYATVKAHCLELFSIRDKANQSPAIKRIFNNLLIDLKTKCPDFWQAFSNESNELSIPHAAGAA